MDLDDEDSAPRLEDGPDRLQEGQRLGQMVERVGEHDDVGRAQLGRDLRNGLRREEALRHRHARLAGHGTEVRRRFEAEHAGASLAEVRELRAVARPDLDDAGVGARGVAAERLLGQSRHEALGEARRGHAVSVVAVVVADVDVVARLRRPARAAHRDAQRTGELAPGGLWGHEIVGERRLAEVEEEGDVGAAADAARIAVVDREAHARPRWRVRRRGDGAMSRAAAARAATPAASRP